MQDKSCEHVVGDRGGGKVRGKGRGGDEREKGRAGNSLWEWDGEEGGREDIGAGKKIPTLRDPF